MDQFTVPQFIEHEAKVVGPFTFKQFIFIGIAGAIGFVLYFTAPFSIFLLATIVLGGGALVLALFRVGGRPLPVVLKNFLFFSFAPKIYLWKKKTGLPPRFVEKTETILKEVEKTAVPTVAGKSRLKDLSTQVETKIKEEIEQ